MYVHVLENKSVKEIRSAAVEWLLFPIGQKRPL